jgi:hypothetical protein
MISNWAKKELSGATLPQGIGNQLKSLKSKIQAIYNVILELSENPSLDRQGELLKQSENYLHTTRILRILKSGFFRDFDIYLEMLDELDSYIENKLEKDFQKEETLELNQLPREAEKESLSLHFKEEPEVKEINQVLEREKTKILGDPYQTRVANFLRTGKILKNQ